MNKSVSVDNGRGLLIAMIDIYPIKRVFLSMLRPSTISSLHAALRINVSIEDEKRYMKVEREVVPNTKELYNFISCGYKVLIAGLEIDRVKQRINNPKHFYMEHLDFKHIVDKVWIIIIKKDINKVADTMFTNVQQLEPLNVIWHKRCCGGLTPICKCKQISNSQFYHPLLDHDSVWYTSNEFREDNVLLYYHPGREYGLSRLPSRGSRPYISLWDDDVRNLSSYRSNDFSNIQYIDIEDDTQSLQFAKPESSVSEKYKEIKIYFFTYKYMAKIIYI